MDQTEELELIEQYYRTTVAWAPSDEEALAIAQDLLEKAQRGFVVDDTGDGLLYASDPDLPVDAEFLALARQGGMRTMFEDGLRQAVRGQTTLSELLRVTRPE